MESLKALQRWLVWKLVDATPKQKKIPYNPTTGAPWRQDRIEDLMTYEQAFGVLVSEPGYTGLGFYFVKGDGLVGIDFDNCLKPEIAERAQKWVTALGSYCEISPSKMGLHIIARGTLPDGCGHKKSCSWGEGWEGQVEAYSQTRYFTYTGNVYKEAVGVKEISNETLAQFAVEFGLVTFSPLAVSVVSVPLFEGKDVKNVLDVSQASQASQAVQVVQASQEVQASLTDEQIIEKAGKASNGAKFRRLWAGDSAGYATASEADLALCGILAFYANGTGQMDRLFRQSGLMRPKWDEVHGEKTYGQVTIEKAFASCQRHYEVMVRPTPLVATKERVDIVPFTGILNGDGEQENLSAGEEKRILSTELFAYFQARHWDLWIDELTDDVRLGEKRLADVDLDTMECQVRDFLVREGWRDQMGVVRQSMSAFAGQNIRHPVKEYLASLPVWDGKDRFAELAGYVDAQSIGIPFARQAEIWLAGAAHRVRTGEFNPVWVWQGPQEIGKSWLAKWLCPLPDLFLESPIRPDDKDCRLRRANVFVWEIDELDATTRKADVSALKAFLTEQQVRDRKPYGRKDIVKPPLASFVGTVNSDTYFQDTTGNRRFLTTRIADINWGYVDVDKSQLWAQAVAAASEKKYRMTCGELAERDRENLEHTTVDPIAIFLEEKLEFTGQILDTVTTAAILSMLKESGVQPTRGVTMAVSEILKNLSCQKIQTQTQGKRERGWTGVKKKFA